MSEVGGGLGDSCGEVTGALVEVGTGVFGDTLSFLSSIVKAQMMMKFKRKRRKEKVKSRLVCVCTKTKRDLHIAC
jgi:hypothetical protein